MPLLGAGGGYWGIPLTGALQLERRERGRESMRERTKHSFDSHADFNLPAHDPYFFLEVYS